jgi:hypothetical protein
VRTRTVLFIPDPFAPEPLPIAVVVEAHGRTVVEPIPVLADLEPAARWCIEVALGDLREAPSVDTLPVGCGPLVMFAPPGDPFKSLPQPIYDAIGRVLDAPENVAALKASLDRAWHEMHEYVGEFHSGPRIRMLDGPPQQGREKAGKAMRDIRRMGKVDLEQVAIALRISIPDVSSLERGEKTTDDAGWTEIQTALFLLGSGKKPEHVADPRSDPSFLRALESCEEETE